MSSLSLLRKEKFPIPLPWTLSLSWQLSREERQERHREFGERVYPGRGGGVDPLRRWSLYGWVVSMARGTCFPEYFPGRPWERTRALRNDGYLEQSPNPRQQLVQLRCVLWQMLIIPGSVYWTPCSRWSGSCPTRPLSLFPLPLGSRKATRFCSIAARTLCSCSVRAFSSFAILHPSRAVIRSCARATSRLFPLLV